MAELSKVVCIWPPIKPMMDSSCKWNTIQRLDRIANNVTCTPRPRTQLWDRCNLPTDKVMKRCFSSYQSHTIIPNEILPTAESFTVLSLKRSSQLPGRHWMIQDWVPSLRHFGEFKVYIVNMEVVYIALARWHCPKAMWEYILPDRFRTLREIQYVNLFPSTDSAFTINLVKSTSLLP